MKKIVIICLSLFLVVGCTNTMNTPSKKVENFLSKYQSLDNDVLTQLDIIVDSDNEMNNDQKKDYKALMQKQYQNLSYKITDEKQEGDNAVVETEIEVFDYSTSINKSKEYFDSHKEEFIENDDKDGITKYIDYKLKELKNVTEKTNYVITFNLHRDNDEWKLEEITDSDIQKLHGLY